MLIKALENFLFPPKCIICKNSVREYDTICQECWKSIKQIHYPYCAKCSNPFEFDMIDENNNICLSCINTPPLYVKNRSAFVYNKTISKLVLRFKFFDDTYLKKFMAKSMVNASADIINNIDILIPVPIHKKRLRERKYNQSLLLCKEIAKMTNKIILDDFLLKKEHTKPQSLLPSSERTKNLKNKFMINEKYNKKLFIGKSFCIVDDVMTTGSTINECVRTINKFGIKNVYSMTFAKTNK
jgi:ComF family protein